MNMIQKNIMAAVARGGGEPVQLSAQQAKFAASLLAHGWIERITRVNGMVREGFVLTAAGRAY